MTVKELVENHPDIKSEDIVIFNFIGNFVEYTYASEEIKNEKIVSYEVFEDAWSKSKTTCMNIYI